MIRFSNGDSDSEGEEKIWRVDRSEKDGSLGENTSGTSTSQSLAASSQMATTTVKVAHIEDGIHNSKSGVE